MDKTRPLNQQQNRFDVFFSTNFINDPTKAPNEQFYAKSIGVIWSIIAESLTLKQQVKEPDIEELKASLKEKQDAVNDVLNKITDASTGIQEELGKSGVGKHAMIFHDTAKANGDDSDTWLKWGLISLGAALGVIAILGFVYFKWVRSATDAISNIEYGILTALVISFISYGIHVCFRNYFAEKHNQKVNLHKANCLSTYFTFIESASEETQQTILQYTTQTIYSHQPTGYAGKGSDTANNPNPIVEIVKNAV